MFSEWSHPELWFWLTPLIPRGRRSILIGLLYSGLSCQEPGSQELKCHGPHSLMSSTWEPILTISLLQHVKPAAWLRFHLHSGLPSWVRLSSSWTGVLQPVLRLNPVLQSGLGAPSPPLSTFASCFNKACLCGLKGEKVQNILIVTLPGIWNLPLLFP